MHSVLHISCNLDKLDLNSAFRCFLCTNPRQNSALLGCLAFSFVQRLIDMGVFDVNNGSNRVNTIAKNENPNPVMIILVMIILPALSHWGRMLGDWMGKSRSVFSDLDLNIVPLYSDGWPMPF
ncbi:hypothetical protein L1987_12663 [Smallanthus sonchifolius]|uniref:Uncharacterized protein n=1 Tax=Smallanthus sonchifolius TaxID=185202 RepID=A0ACB9JER5_9ASTR|nr:hypothetical protein L1987_12663 [Smallanthus sonchifolius]